MANTMTVLMEALGLDGETVGHGNYSQVYSTNRGTILKVTVDDAYMKFVDAVQGVDNPLLPKILTNFGMVGKIKSSGKEKYVPLYAVELPRYLDLRYAYSSQEYNDAYVAADFIKSYLRSWMGSHNAKPRHYSDVCSALLSLGVDWNDFWDAIEICNKIISQKREGFSSMYGDDTYGFFDTHIENWMIEPESGQLILNDPVGGRNYVDGIDAYYEYEATFGEALEHLDFEKAAQIQKLLGDGIDNTIFQKFKMHVEYARVIEPMGSNGCTISVKKSEKFKEVKMRHSVEFSNDPDLLAVLGLSSTYCSRKSRYKALQAVKAREDARPDLGGYGIGQAVEKQDGYGICKPEEFRGVLLDAIQEACDQTFIEGMNAPNLKNFAKALGFSVCVDQ